MAREEVKPQSSTGVSPVSLFFGNRRDAGATSVSATWRRMLCLYLCTSAFICGSFLFSGAQAEDSKPRVAVFPLAGDAPADLREKAGFSFRAKLDRDGHFEPIDGPTMIDMADEKRINYQTPLKKLEDLSKDAQVSVFIWGELDNGSKGLNLRIKLFDVNQPDPLPHEFEKPIAQPTDLRFAVEDILQTLEGVKPFEHPNEEAVVDDARSAALFKKNPNLLPNGDFSATGHWQALLGSDTYAPPISDALPDEDRVGIYRLTDIAGHTETVLAMNLSKNVAENNGLACLSDSISIQPHTRYRLQFRYRSDGPTLHVFVKGYTTGKTIAGEKTDREVYRRQVPPSGPTSGQWSTVTCDLNPENPSFAVDRLRVDLYAYLTRGIVMFADIQLKAVSE
jgi:hypothetical protein